MQLKKIETVRSPGSSHLGPDIRQIIPSAVKNIDPFVFLDHYGPFEKKAGWEGVPGHPHAGIATITYVMEGTNKHEDSLGNTAAMDAGDLAWMVAGKGIIHAEGNFSDANESEISHGVQFWVSLPAHKKFVEPKFDVVRNAEFPILKRPGMIAKVLVGELWGETSPVVLISPTFIYEIMLGKNAAIEIPIPAGNSTGIYVISGLPEINGVILQPTSIANMEVEGTGVSLNASASARVLIFGGKPLDEPIFSYSSFVMNSEEQIHQVINAYNNGEMGRINQSKSLKQDTI